MTTENAVAPGTVRPEISESVHDLDSAKRYLDGLIDAGLVYHLEDNPAEIVRGSTGEALFTPAECQFLRRRVRTMYALRSWGEHGCPIGYVLRAEARRDFRRHLASCSANDAARDRAVSMDYTSWRVQGHRPGQRVDLETRVTDLLTRGTHR